MRERLGVGGGLAQGRQEIGREAGQGAARLSGVLPSVTGVKLVIQIPCLNEEATLPRVLAQLPREVDGFDEVEWLVDRRRLERSDGRGRPRARGRPRRQADQQQGPRRRLPGRHRRRPEAGRGRDRQHRRRPPVPGRRHPEAGRADPRRPRRHGGRRPAGQGRRALLGLEEAAPAARKLGGAARLGNRDSRHDVGLSRLQPGGGAAAPGRLQLHLHAREPDPGGQDAGRGRARPDRRPTRRLASRGSSTPPRAYVRRNALAVFRAYVLYEPLRVFTVVACVFGVAALHRLDARSCSTGSSTATEPATSSR